MASAFRIVLMELSLIAIREFVRNALMHAPNALPETIIVAQFAHSTSLNIKPVV